jgi:hypothetical protein
MGKATKALGKSVGNSLGYTVRMMVGTKTDEKTKVTHKIHNGKFGIYAGKNKIDEANDIDDAVSKINKLVAQNIIDNQKVNSRKK